MVTRPMAGALTVTIPRLDASCNANGRTFHAGETTDFYNFARMRDDGMNDVAAMITRFAGSGAIGEMDSLYSYWATDRAASSTRMRRR
jgi:hypothetical protein